MRAEQTGWRRALPAKTRRRPHVCRQLSEVPAPPARAAASLLLGPGLPRAPVDWGRARVRLQTGSASPPTRDRNCHIRSGKPPPESGLIRLFPNMESTAGASGGLAGAGGGRGPHLPGPAMLRQRCGGASYGGGQTCIGRGALSPGRAGPPGPAFPRARL